MASKIRPQDPTHNGTLLIRRRKIGLTVAGALDNLTTIRTYLSRGKAPHFAITFSLLFLHLLSIIPVRFPTIFYDELLYLGYARLFSGTATMPALYLGVLGHFGYSLLITPLFWMFGSFAAQYRAVLIVNCILLSVVYPLLYRILRLLVPTLDRQILMVVSATSCLYPAFLLYPSLAASENAFIPSFLLFTLATLEFLRKPSNLRGLLWALSSIFVFAVHARGIATIAVAIGLAIYGLLTRRVPLLAGFLSLFSMCAGYFVIIATKAKLEAITGVLFPRAANTVPITWIDWNRFGVCVLGEVSALCIATFGLYALGIAGLVKLGRNREAESGARATSIQTLVVHVLGLIGSALFISSQTLQRLDHIVITRYNEGTIILFIAFGLIYLYEILSESRLFLAWGTLIASFTVVAYFALRMQPALPKLDSIPVDHILRLGILGLVPIFRLLRTGDFSGTALLACLISFTLLFLSLRRWQWVAALCSFLFVSGAAEVWFLDVYTAQHAYFQSSSSGSPAVLSRDLGRLSGEGKRDVGFDAAIWDPFDYSSYVLFHPELRFHLFDSRKGETSNQPAVVADPRWGDTHPYHRVAQERYSEGVLWLKDSGK